MRQFIKHLFCSLFHRKHFRFWWTDSDYFHSCKKCGYAEKLLAILFCCSTAISADVITFTPSTSVGVTNYSIYYGPHPSRSSTNRIHIGVATMWTITGIPPAQPEFFFATAWTNGVESVPSNEILYTNKNFAPTIQINMILEKGPSPFGPYIPTTNQLTYFAATEGSEYFRVRMEATTK